MSGCPVWCQADTHEFDPVDLSEYHLHTALLGQVGTLSLHIEQLVLDYQPDPITALALRNSADRGSSVDLPADPDTLRQAVAMLQQAVDKLS